MSLNGFNFAAGITARSDLIASAPWRFQPVTDPEMIARAKADSIKAAAFDAERNKSQIKTKKTMKYEDVSDITPSNAAALLKYLQNASKGIDAKNVEISGSNAGKPISSLDVYLDALKDRAGAALSSDTQPQAGSLIRITA